MWKSIKYCLLCMARILGSGSVPGMTWKEVGIGFATLCVVLGIAIGLLMLLCIIFEKIGK